MRANSGQIQRGQEPRGVNPSVDYPELKPRFVPPHFLPLVSGLGGTKINYGGSVMLSKCANPECSNSFRYLSQGTLFRWDGLAKAQHRLNLVPNPVKNPIPRIEFYWLCKDCSSHLVVVYREGIGITVRPLVSLKAAS
jgi:hypothetical protein